MSSKKYCYCRRGNEGFIIFCDRCHLWFHGACVNVTKRQSETLDTWHCAWCDQIKKAEDSFQSNCSAMIRCEITRYIQDLRPSVAETSEQLVTDELKCSLQKLEGENQNLKSVVQVKEEEIHLLKQHVSQIESSKQKLIDELGSSLEKLNHEKQSLQSIIQSKDQEISDLKQQLVQSGNSNQVLMSELGSKVVELEKLKLSLLSNMQSKEQEDLQKEEETVQKKSAKGIILKEDIRLSKAERENESLDIKPRKKLSLSLKRPL